MLKLWIYDTNSKFILQIIVTKGVTIYIVWMNLETYSPITRMLVGCNLKVIFVTLSLVILSIIDYCHKFEVIYSLIANIDQSI